MRDERENQLLYYRQTCSDLSWLVQTECGQRIEWVSRITMDGDYYHIHIHLYHHIHWRDIHDIALTKSDKGYTPPLSFAIALTNMNIICPVDFYGVLIDPLSNMISRSEPRRSSRRCCLITDTTRSENGEDYQIPYFCIYYLIGLCC